MEDQALVQKYFDELMGFATKKVKKSTIRRIVALVVVLCLFFGLLGFLIGRASAYTAGSFTTPDIIFEEHPQYPSQNNAGIDKSITVLGYLSNPSEYRVCNMVVDVIGSGAGRIDLVFTCVSFGELMFIPTGNSLGVREGLYSSLPSDTARFVSYTNGSTFNIDYASSSSVGTFISDSYGIWYRFGSDSIKDPFLHSNATFYSSSNLYFPSIGLLVSENLDISAYLPDTRYLNCYEKSVYGTPYIIVEASDSPQNLVSISFTYTDSLGTFGKTFLADELSYRPNRDSSSPSMFYFQIDPNDISTYRFTLNSCTYYAAGSYGSKTVSDLNIVFNEQDVSLPIGYDTITYIEHFNEVFTGAGWVSGLTTVYVGYFDGYPLSKYYFDIDRSLVQPFSIRVLFLPDFLFSDQYPNAQEFSIQNFYSMFEQYDCIVSGCEEDFFDEVYGTGSYDLVHNYRVTYNFDAALNKVMALHEAAHILPFEYVDDVPIVTQTQIDVGILYNRSFLMKQILYSFGDIDDRLLEFEVNLLGEDGVLAGLQEQWVLGYESSNNFYNVLLDKLADLGYAINGLNFDFSDSINQRLDRIIGYLDFDLEVDFSKLSEPWLDIFTFAKNMFEDSEPMWDSIGSSADTLYNGLPVSGQYNVEQLPVIEGPIPLFPTIAPVPLFPTFSPTLVPLGGG